LSSLLLRHHSRCTLFPYTTLFRSSPGQGRDRPSLDEAPAGPPRETTPLRLEACRRAARPWRRAPFARARPPPPSGSAVPLRATKDRKSTRLNSSHVKISYAVFCLK